MAYADMPTVYGLMQEMSGGSVFDPNSLISSGILAVQAEPLGLTGRDILIGFVDTGIRYELEAFRRSDGGTRIVSLWDQVTDTVYTANQIDEALQSENPQALIPENDPGGHGTAMASVAAGSRVGGGRTYIGAAPDSRILFVKLQQASQELRDFYLIPESAACYSETDIIAGLEYLDRIADELGQPLVICFGLGTNLGAHSGSSVLERYMDVLALKKNRCIVNCCGNEGNKQHHFIGIFTNNPGNLISGSPNQIMSRDMEIRVGENVPGFTLSVWGTPPYQYRFSVRAPGGEQIRDIQAETGGEVTYSFVFERTLLYLDTQRVAVGSGAQLLFMRFVNPTNGIWTITVTETEITRSAVFHAWLPIRDFITGSVTFLEPSPNITLTCPSTAANPISVSTYDDVNNSFYTASGRGFTRDARPKPDICAPGVNVSTAIGKVTGSSIAAAITAGAAAQFMQWAVQSGRIPNVTTVDVKNYMIRAADRDSAISYPSREWGFGRLNIGRIFDELAGREYL